MFNKAFTHISGCIDQIYKDLTKGKAAPMGGVAYLSLEDNEVWHDSYAKVDSGRLMLSFRNLILLVSNIMLCRL